MNDRSLQSGPSLANVSACDRLGIKGWNSAQWLAGIGVVVPPEPNRLVVRDDGLVVARYGASEFAFADAADGASGAVERLRQTLESSRPAGCFGVPRADSQAAFALSGSGVRRALSAVCPADLRERAFKPGDVLQTLCAGVSAQLWNLSDATSSKVLVLCDSSVAHHQWAALERAVQGARREAVPLGGGRAA